VRISEHVANVQFSYIFSMVSSQILDSPVMRFISLTKN